MHGPARQGPRGAPDVSGFVAQRVEDLLEGTREAERRRQEAQRLCAAAAFISGLATVRAGREYREKVWFRENGIPGRATVLKIAPATTAPKG